MEKLAEKLKELRIEKGLSQREVSSALGMTRNAFTNYENGYREPSLDNLKKICQFFDVSADYLLGLKDFYKHLNRPRLQACPKARRLQVWFRRR